MPKLTPAQMKKAIEAYNKVSLNIGRNVGDKVNSLTDKEIEAAIMSRFPGARIDSHKVIPAQPNTKFGPFEPTSQVTMQANPGSLESQLHSLSQDLQQQAIPGINHTTGTGVLSGPGAADWGGKFDKGYFVHPGDTTAFGNRQEDFKKQFTGGFYHGSPSNKIKAFDPTHPAADFEKSAEAIYLSRDPSFSNSILPMGNAAGYRPGSTVYPVSANLGKHFDYEAPEGQQVIKEYLAKLHPVPSDEKELTQWMRDRALTQSKLKSGSWPEIENPEFQKHLIDTGHDSFSMQEAGRKNVGIFEPHNIRGKFADYNPDEAMNPDFMKAAGGSIIKGTKKVLEHARSLPVFHYSKQPSLTELDPRFYGSKEGIKGQEARRLKGAQDIRDRSYFYVDAGEDTMKPEQGLGPFKYQGTAHDIYDLANDPAGYGAIARQKALDPYMLEHGREMVDPELHANELERAIKGAGYSGYSNDKVGLTWEPLPVIRSE